MANDCVCFIGKIKVEAGAAQAGKVNDADRGGPCRGRACSFHWRRHLANWGTGAPFLRG